MPRFIEDRSFGSAIAMILFLSSFALSGACTARYSHSLSGPIPKASGTEVSSSSTGLSVFAITFTEPDPAHKQVISLLGACNSLDNVQVDYREKVFLIVGIPEISVKANCVK